MSQLPPALFDELKSLADERDILSDAMAQASQAQLPPALDMMITHGLAGYIEQIYTGAERCLSIIAKAVDNSPIGKDEGWHRALLDRMSVPYGDRRPAVLSAASLEILQGLRSFRHVVRNTYGSRLDQARVLELAAEAMKLPDALIADIDTLDAALRAKS